MKFALFVLGVVLIVWLIILVIEYQDKIAGNLGRFLRILIVISVILFLIFVQYKFGGDLTKDQRIFVPVKVLEREHENLKLY